MNPIFLLQGGKGDPEYIAAFQQIVMPVAYEVCGFVEFFLSFSVHLPYFIGYLEVFPLQNSLKDLDPSTGWIYIFGIVLEETK